MAIVKSFKAVRPAISHVKDVAALPYDVMNRQEALEEIQDKPYSFLRIDRAETTLDSSIDTYDEKVYKQAVKNFQSMVEQGIFVQDQEAAFYIYELTMDGRSQTGLVACASVDEYLSNKIKKHEKTREDKEIDRIRHVDSLNANTGPIFLTYRHRDDLNKIINEQKTKASDFAFIADDGIKHQAWTISDKEVIKQLENAFAQVENLYIADGHHRCASAVKVAQMRRQENPDYTGSEEFNYFLSVIFPDSELKIFDYNRLVKDLNGLSICEFLASLEDLFIVKKQGKEIYHPNTKAEFSMYLEGEWYQLTAKEGSYDPSDAIDSLDVSILQDNLLEPILAIEDPRTDQRIDFVGGIRGLEELERRVDNGEMKVAFALYPTSIEELFAVADADFLMPPKSTWFEPKLRSGLFIHLLDD